VSADDSERTYHFNGVDKLLEFPGHEELLTEENVDENGNSFYKADEGIYVYDNEGSIIFTADDGNITT